MASPLLRQALGYRKFVTARIRAIVMDSGYHLQGECIRALRSLGHEASALSVASDATAGQVIDALLHALVRLRPDFILAINHIGFDTHGDLGHVLAELGFPVAVWYVDSPFFVLRCGALPAAEVSTVFVWERAYLPLMHQLGATDVHYLPLACELPTAPPQQTPARWPVTFVGDSMHHARETWDARLDAPQRRAARLLAEALSQDRTALLAPLTGTPAAAETDMIAAAAFAATGTYRTRLLRRVAAKFPLHVFGDAGWRRAVPKARWLGPVNYGPELQGVYAASAVSLNATSLQMPTAVNQRVFDIPAAGGLVLTDAQEDASTLFEPNREIITYRDADELCDKVSYYVDHPEAARGVIQAARQRIAQQHTYSHRLQQVVQTLSARHAHSHARAL